MRIIVLNNSSNYMKKVFFAFLFCAALANLSSGCSANDDNNDLGMLSGKWRIDKEIFTDSNGQQQQVDFPYNNPDCPKSFFDFGQDDVLGFGTYNFECTEGIEPGTWSQDGNLVSVEIPDSNILINDVWEVVQKSSTKMKVKVISANGVPAENVVYLTFIKY